MASGLARHPIQEESMRTKPSLRQIAAVLALAAALAAGSPVHAAPSKASSQPAIFAGDLFAPLRALLEQAAGALRALWSPEGETTHGTREGETGDGPQAPALPGTSDLLENGAGIDPNG
jgi:hypothetical protein